MIYFVTGVTGAVVPVIVEELLRKDPEAFFYLALRPDRAGNHVASRFDALVARLELTDSEKVALHQRMAVRPPRRMRSPLECSDGTRPR